MTADYRNTTKLKRNHSSNFHEGFIYVLMSLIMDLNLREPNSDTGALADQAYAASPADAAKYRQRGLLIGVILCNWGPTEVSGNNGPESQASPYRVVYVSISQRGRSM